MNEQLLDVTRVHHFYVAVAKYVFTHPKYGIVCVSDPISLKEAETYQLSPLLLYGLTVASLPIRWLTFTSVDKPRAFKDILLDGWRNAKGLRGQPDELIVSRHLAAACPNLIHDMDCIGVRVTVAGAQEKALPASLRVAQNACKELIADGPTSGIQQLCSIAQMEHDWGFQPHNFEGYSSDVKFRAYRWLSLTPRIPVHLLNSNILDWDTHTDAWLVSWQSSSLRSNLPRHFHTNGSSTSGEKSTWLRTGFADESCQDFDEDDDLSHDDASRLVSNMIQCWPNPPDEIADSLGMTEDELEDYLSENGSYDPDTEVELMELFGIEYEEMIDGFLMHGPYVLVARSPSALEAVYLTLTCGGDAYPCEIIPDKGMADPSWRYVLINRYDLLPSIVMAPRGEKITDDLPRLLLNYGGIWTVPRDFFRCIVSTCAHACIAPDFNSAAMMEFCELYERLGLDYDWSESI